MSESSGESKTPHVDPQEPGTSNGAAPETRPTVDRIPKFAVSIRVAERRAEVWKLRKSGLTYDEIAKRLGATAAQIASDITACFKRYRTLTEKETEDARRLELERLDAVQAAWWDRAVGTKFQPAEERAWRVIEGVMNRRAKLLGLDAPAQARVDVAVTLDQIIGDTPAVVAAVEANRDEREAFLSSRGQPVPQLDHDEAILDADYEEIEPPEQPEEEEFILDEAAEG